MSEYVNEDLGVRFTMPDAPTVGQQLKYRGRVFAAGQFTDDVYSRYWQGLLAVVDEWTGTEKNGKGYEACKLIPDPQKLDFEKETSIRVADVVQWAGNTAARHMLSLEEVDPN